ncbi:MAG: hypothetical protein SFU98_13725 [Leptospiraceae bacterium]|nr:hypothetical protein [Leptospiraceae bacterium]
MRSMIEEILELQDDRGKSLKVLLTQIRNLYLSELTNAFQSAETKSYIQAEELFLDSEGNPAESDPLDLPYRVDIVKFMDNTVETEMVDSEKRLKFNPIYGKIQETKIVIEPFSWDYVKININPPSNTFIDKLRTWAKQSILTENPNEEFKNCMHSLVRMYETAEQFSLLLDLGTLEIIPFVEIISIAVLEKSIKIEITSG